ncbi:MAG: N-acetyltransferase family protein [Candidatus Bathyarchaeia archaeon]|jgi:ribosomal protein S18 acetylase RimI-like enzyme
MLRQAQPSDAKAIVDVLVDSFLDKFNAIFGRRINRVKEALVRYYQQPNALSGVFVAEVNSETAGIIQIVTTNTPNNYRGSLGLLWGLGVFGAVRAVFAFMAFEHKVENNECYVEHLAVASAFRGRGIGKRLLGLGEEVAREKKKTAYSLFVASDNEAALQLYKSTGFLEVKKKRSIITRLILGKRTFIFMQKKLSV